MLSDPYIIPEFTEKDDIVISIEMKDSEVEFRSMDEIQLYFFAPEEVAIEKLPGAPIEPYFLIENEGKIIRDGDTTNPNDNISVQKIEDDSQPEVVSAPDIETQKTEDSTPQNIVEDILAEFEAKEASLVTETNTITSEVTEIEENPYPVRPDVVQEIINPSIRPEPVYIKEKIITEDNNIPYTPTVETYIPVPVTVPKIQQPFDPLAALMNEEPIRENNPGMIRPTNPFWSNTETV